MNSRERSRLALLMWPLLLIFLLVSLLAALHWYVSQDLSSLSFTELSPTYLVLGILLQMLALVLVTLAWHVNLHRQGARDFSFRQSFTMVGISTIGKYTPGKIWGMLARGAMVYQHGGQSKPALIATLVEQLALFHSGAVLAMAALVAISVNPTMGIAAGLLMLPTVWWTSRSEHLLSRLLTRLKRADQLDWSGFSASYSPVFAILLCMWLVVAAVLGLTVGAYGTALPGFSLILLAAVLSYIGGFLAVFAPAGLGVREGIVVAILTPVTGPAAALSVSLLHRLVTAAADILMGALALFLLGNGSIRNAPPDANR